MNKNTRLNRHIFNSVAKTFHDRVQVSPNEVTLKIATPLKNEFSYTEFVGESKIEYSNVVTVKALYNREISPKTRSKYGLDASASAIIYLSPKDLYEKLGRWHISESEISVNFLGIEYLVYKIFYDGHVPEFSNCISVTMVLTSVKGY
jgi:hypothetical protein